MNVMPSHMLVRRGFGVALVPTLVAAVVGCTTPDIDAGTAIAGASAAMGGTQLKSIRYSAEGTGYTFGQAFVPGMPWPKITLHAFTRSINYDTSSMRDEITLSRAEPKGGGGYPLQGEQRNDQYVSGAFA